LNSANQRQFNRIIRIYFGDTQNCFKKFILINEFHLVSVEIKESSL